MYNDFLKCETCKKDLTRPEQKQYLDILGFTHIFCKDCYDKASKAGK